MELLDDLGLPNNIQIRQPEGKHYLIYAGVMLLLFGGLYASVKSGLVGYYIEAIEAKEGAAICGLIALSTLFFYHFTITVKTRLRLVLLGALGVFLGAFVAIMGTSLVVDLDTNEHELSALGLWLLYTLTTISLPAAIHSFRSLSAEE